MREVDLLIARINALEARVSQISVDEIVADLPVFPPNQSDPLDHSFKVSISGDVVTLGFGWVNRVGSPGIFYGDQTLGTMADDTAYWIFCSIKYEPNSSTDTIAFALEGEESDPWEYPQERETVNYRYIAIARIDEARNIRYYHIGDIHYIHFDPCKNCEGAG